MSSPEFDLGGSKPPKPDALTAWGNLLIALGRFLTALSCLGFLLLFLGVAFWVIAHAF